MIYKHDDGKIYIGRVGAGCLEESSLAPTVNGPSKVRRGHTPNPTSGL